MNVDYGDWDRAIIKLIERIEAGAWRHGLKTKDAAREFLRLGKFPSDPAAMWAPRYKAKNGAILRFLLYYWVQKAIKDRRWTLVGKSGRKYRPRRIYSIKHGCAEGELKPNGDPMTPEREGLWLRWQDLRRDDARQIRTAYRFRETDSGPDKAFIDRVERVLTTKADDMTAGDVIGEVAEAM